MGWFIGDACDTVKPSPIEERFNRTPNSMALKLAEAKRNKGTLTLNNGQPMGGSWKTPKLEFALQSRSGYKGGETE